MWDQINKAAHASYNKGKDEYKKQYKSRWRLSRPTTAPKPSTPLSIPICRNGCETAIGLAEFFEIWGGSPSLQLPGVWFHCALGEHGHDPCSVAEGRLVGTSGSPAGASTRRVAPLITAPFYAKVSIFTALYLDNYWVRNEKTSDSDVGRRPELKSEVFSLRTLYLLR